MNGETMRIRRFLGSPRLAAALIAALLALSVLSVVFPQTSTLGSEVVGRWREAEPWIAEPVIALGLTRVFHSWPYYAVSVLLAVNLTVCTFDRALARRRSGEPSLGTAPGDATEVRRVGAGGDMREVLARGMRGFEVLAVEGGVVCRGGRGGFAGSVLMHAGFVVLVLAGIVTGLTQFEGVIILTEGLGAEDAPSSYVETPRVPSVGAPYTGAFLTLDRMEFEYVGPTITESRAFLAVDEDGVRHEYVARVNHPLRVGTKSFLLKDSGLAAGLRVTDPSGTVLPAAMVNLGRQVPEGYADSAEFAGLRLGLLAVPDADAPRGAMVAQRLALVKPAVIVSATVDGRQVASDVKALPGESLDAGGWRVEVLEVRRWTGFNARVDFGMYVAYVGFALAVVGSALRVLDPDRVVRVRLEGGRALVWARARWGPRLATTAVERAAAALAVGDAARDGRGHG